MPAQSIDEEPSRRIGSVRLRLALLSGAIVLVVALIVTTVTGGLPYAPLAAVGAALIAWVVADRTLRPVGALEAQYRAIGSGDPRRRVDVPSGEDEPARLARTMNAALDAREAATRAGVALVGEAARSLRDPLDAVRAELVAAERAEPADATAAVRRALTALNRLQDTAADVLLLASLRAGERPRRGILPWFEVMSDVRPPTDVEYTVEGDLTTLVLGARVHLALMIQYLLDEAAHHARSSVVLRIAAFDDAVVLRVDDDGPPFTDAERERAFAPFAEGAAPRPEDGRTGLGIVVVDEIARAHGGSVSIEESPRGGSRVRVDLPAIAPGARAPA